MDKKRAKTELRDAAIVGILNYLRSTRGSYLFGPKAELGAVDYNLLQIKVPASMGQGPTYFEVKISERF